MGKVVRGDLQGILTFTAELAAKGQVAIVPRVVARLDKLDVEVGSRVRAGDTLAELDHTDLEQQVLQAQANQAEAEAKLNELKAGPKPEALAAAQANLKAAQARVQALEQARQTSDPSALQRRVEDARAALAQAQTATQPDPQAVAQADAAVSAAQAKLNQLQSDPAHQNDRAALDAARAELQRAQAAANAARTPTGSQAAVEEARRNLNEAQQAQLLAQLSLTAFDLDQARALEEAADAQLKLVSAPASENEIKAAQSSVERAFALAELARAQLREATLTAPINGIVAQISASVGSTVGPGTAIVTLIPPELQVLIQVDEAQTAQLQTGQTAQLSVATYPRDAFTGTVKSIAPVLDPRTHTVAVQVEVPDPQEKLRPGMLTQLAIQTGQRQGALLVPKEAILKLASVDTSAPPQTVVYTVVNSRVHRQVISIGATDAHNAEVVQGLTEGVDLVLNPRPDFLEGELISAG
jgi:HlyD family secretion protein